MAVSQAHYLAWVTNGRCGNGNRQVCLLPRATLVCHSTNRASPLYSQNKTGKNSNRNSVRVLAWWSALCAQAVKWKYFTIRLRQRRKTKQIILRNCGLICYFSCFESKDSLRGRKIKKVIYKKEVTQWRVFCNNLAFLIGIRRKNKKNSRSIERLFFSWQSRTAVWCHFINPPYSRVGKDCRAVSVFHWIARPDISAFLSDASSRIKFVVQNSASSQT